MIQGLHNNPSQIASTISNMDTKQMTSYKKTNPSKRGIKFCKRPIQFQCTAHMLTIHCF